MARRTLRLSLVAALSVTALAACAPPAKDKGSGGGWAAMPRRRRRLPTSVAWTAS